MHETKQQITQRKIYNGLRKQAEVIQHEKEKVWDILKQEHEIPGSLQGGWKKTTMDHGYFYCPYIPILRENTVINIGDTSA